MPSDTSVETRVQPRQTADRATVLPAGAGLLIGVVAGAGIWAILLVIFAM
jgi:hypothetical protein